MSLVPPALLAVMTRIGLFGQAWAFAGVNWERFLSEVRPRRPAQQTVGQ